MVGVGAAPSWGSGPGVVLPVFETFQAARLDFAQQLGKLADTPEPGIGSTAPVGPGSTFEVGGRDKVLAALEASSEMLVPQVTRLAADLAPSVQQSAMLAMGRLCQVSNTLSAKMSEKATIKKAIDTLGSAASASHVKSSLYLLTQCVNSSDEAARHAVQLGALGVLCERIEEADSSIKTAAVWTLSGIAQHDNTLAGAILDSGALALLVQCLKEPSLPLRRIALSCLGSIAKHPKLEGHDTIFFAEVMYKEGVIELILQMLMHQDSLTQRHACRTLALAIQHKEAFVEWVPTASRTHVIQILKSTTDDTVAMFASTLLQQLARLSSRAAQELWELGAIPPLLAFIAAGNASPLPAASTLSYMCSATAEAATDTLEQGGVAILQNAISGRPPHVCARIASAVAALVRSVPDKANEVGASGILLKLTQAAVLSGAPVGADSLALARTSLSDAIAKCTDYPALLSLMEALPLPESKKEQIALRVETELLVAVFKALAATMSTSPNLRYDFKQRGALEYVQRAKHSPSSTLREALKQINATFPKQMVSATNPAYEQSLLDKIK